MELDSNATFIKTSMAKSQIAGSLQTAHSIAIITRQTTAVKRDMASELS
jgi:hypothetical protein